MINLNFLFEFLLKDFKEKSLYDFEMLLESDKKTASSSSNSSNESFTDTSIESDMNTSIESDMNTSIESNMNTSIESRLINSQDSVVSFFSDTLYQINDEITVPSFNITPPPSPTIQQTSSEIESPPKKSKVSRKSARLNLNK